MKKLLLSLLLLSISMLTSHAMEELIPSYDILLPEFQECLVQSTQIPTDFDVFDPQHYETWVSLQINPDIYAECLENYTRALGETFAKVYAGAIEGLSFAEFVDSINWSDKTIFTYKSPTDIMQSRYSSIANKNTISKAFQKKCKNFKTFVEVYEYAQKIFLMPIKTSLTSLAITFDTTNKYFDYLTDSAVASHCFHKPISLNLKAFKYVHSLNKVFEKQRPDAQFFSAAMGKYLTTGVSPNMNQSIQDIHETVEILKMYLCFKPNAVFIDEDISFADLCSYIAFACTTQKKSEDLHFFYRALPIQYVSRLLNLAIKWIIYHRLRTTNCTKINEETAYFFTINKQSFMSDVDSRLLFQLALDTKKSGDAQLSIMMSIDLLLDEPKRLAILKKILNLYEDDIIEIEQIIALSTQ